MRTLNKLYLILWEEIKDKQSISGLCAEILDLLYEEKITDEEYSNLKYHFINQKPSNKQHEEFTKNERFTDDEWWWDTDEDEDPVNRKLFIQKMIKITENE